METANFRFVDYHPREESIRDIVLRGLKTHPRAIPAKFLYDKTGSELFNSITQQPEYYQTRTEIALLEERGGEMAEWIGPGAMVIEYGSGHSRKIRSLLSSLRDGRCYLAIDISKQYLIDACRGVARDYPELEVIAVCGDFIEPLELPAPRAAVRKRVVFFPGSTIGNFEPHTARKVLGNARAQVGRGGGLLIGIDLKKSQAVLDAAYNDAAGVTAAFELNLLQRLNRELDADFDPEAFAYRGKYEPGAGRVEMYLVSLKQQTVTVAGERIPFAEGDTIHTENSYKFEIAEFEAFAGEIGFVARQAWTDAEGKFALCYLEVL